MAHSSSIPAPNFRLLIVIVAEGLDVAALLHDAGFAAAGLDAPETRFPADEISGPWQLAVNRSGKPTLGLSRELAARHGNLDALGHAMACSANMAASIPTQHWPSSTWPTGATP